MIFTFGLIYFYSPHGTSSYEKVFIFHLKQNTLRNKTKAFIYPYLKILYYIKGMSKDLQAELSRL